MLILAPNPCFDATFFVEELVPGSVHRSQKNSYTPGGKGINVARACKTLGEKSNLLVMLPRVEGDLYKELLGKDLENVSYQDINGGVRHAILINKENSTENTVIVGKGPDATEADWEIFCSLVGDLVKPGEIVTEMGSLTPGYPTDALKTLADVVHSKGAKLLVDTSPACLKTRGDAIFDFISPNLDEAEALINDSSEAVYIPNSTDIEKRALDAAKKLQNVVSTAVFVTAGSHGMAIKTDEIHTWIPAYTVPKERFKSAVGAGDCFVAGFTTHFELTGNLEESVKFGMATAAAQCETYEPGNLNKDRALEIFRLGRA